MVRIIKGKRKSISLI